MKPFIHRLLTGVIGIVALCFLAGTDTPQPPQPAALTPTAYDALTEFDKAGQAADEVWKKSMLIAQNKLVEKLKKARIAATKDSDLDAANAIDVRLKTASAAAAAMSPESHALVTRARYVPIGQEAKAVDVTDLIKSCEHGDSLDLTGAKFPDPTPGVHKFLMMEGSLGGTPYVIHLYDEGIMGFSFGRLNTGGK